MEKGYIYKGSYKGWYCVADEEYLAEADVVKEESSGKMVKRGHNNICFAVLLVSWV